MPQLTIVETSTYLELLVGEMPAEPCESTTHHPDDAAHDDGPAVVYARMTCPICGHTAIKAYCQGFIDFMLGGGRVEHTKDCEPRLGTEWLTILGPVGRLS